MARTYLSASLRSLLLLLAFGGLLVPAAVMGQSGEASAEKVPYATIADLLENEQARQQLIGELRRLSTQASQESGQQAQPPASQSETTSGDGEKATSGETGEALSLPRRVADITRRFVQQLGDRGETAVAALVALQQAPANALGIDAAAVAWEALELALLIAGAVIALLALRRLVRPLYRRAGHWVQDEMVKRSSALRRLVAIALCAVVDVIVILLAGVVAYGIAVFALGEAGAIDTSESLFINAFVLVEVFKALIRVVFAARYEGLRLFVMPEEVAVYWSRWLTRLTGFVGYGLLVAVPIITAQVSPAMGELASLLIMLAAYIYALVVILRNRRAVGERLRAKAQEQHTGVGSATSRVLAKTWHLLAIGYFTALFVVSQVYPERALPFMVISTLQTLLAVGGGVLLSGILKQLIGREIWLSEGIRRRMPTLQRQLNAYIPTALKIIRVVIVVVVAVVIADAWELFDLEAWLASNAGQTTLAIAANVALIVVLAALVWIAVASLIEHRLSADTGTGAPTAREKTLLALFLNAVAIAIITLTLMIVLSEVGVDIGPLLASAGVLGLAIGFGAQKLVQDIITGVFIQLDNAMNTDDVVTVAGITGTAEKLSIRSVGIRDLSGTYHLIPFSSVDTVSNYMRDFAFHVGEYGVAYRENVDEVITHLKAAFDELRADPAHAENILSALEVMGVIALADSSVNVRIRIKTKPGAQWATGRAYNQLVKKHFDAAGIEIPYPHLTLYFGQDKDGSAPPVPLKLTETPFVLDKDSRPSGSADDKRATQQPAAKTRPLPEDDKPDQ